LAGGLAGKSVRPNDFSRRGLVAFARFLNPSWA